MDNSDSRFPASAALHGRLFRDRTLAEFEERRLCDPDHGTAYAGTVDELPPPGDGFLEAQIELRERDRFPATEEPVPVALAEQNAKARASRRWLRNLSPKRRRELIDAIPSLSIAL